MPSIGSASLSITPSFAGFQSSLDRGAGKALTAAGAKGGRSYGEAAGRSASRSFGSTLRKLGGLGAALGVADFVKDSVQLEAAFGKTMAQIRVATGAPAEQLARLDALAIKLGKDTIFSANDASGAMLELAKNGIKPATIESGALSSALTLAAAGSVDLTEAAQTMGNTLNAFNLKGKDSNRVAAALAGAANASSASVGDLSYALSQVGLSANSVGFTVEDTTAILAGFANAGIQGSDAGTSLKVMLDRLQPTTTRAEAAMRGLGVITEDGRNQFIKANGEFESAAKIAELLRLGTEDLTDAEAKRQLTQAFGQDAQRAALVLAKEGAKGIKDLTKATSDQGAADKMAKANMEGTAGAIERLKGSWETAKLQFGKFIAPAVVQILDAFSQGIEDSGPKLKVVGDWLTQDGIPAMKEFAGHVKDVAAFLNDLPKSVKIGGLAALIGGVGYAKLRGGAMGGGGLLGGIGKAVGLAKPVPVFVTNPGFGGGLPTGPTSKLGKVGAIASKAAGPAAIVGAAAVGLNEFRKWNHEGDSPIEHMFGGKVGQMARDFFDSANDGAKEYDKSLGVVNNAWAKVGHSTDGAREKVVAYDGTIRGLPKEWQTVVKAVNLESVLWGARQYKGMLEGIPREVVTTFVRNVKTNNDTGESGDPRFGGFRAHGGSMHPGYTYRVGENGPETVTVGARSTVTPNDGGGTTFVLMLDGEVLDHRIRQVSDDRYAANRRHPTGRRR